MPIPPVTISACVIAKNEEHSIERCLRSLNFADEIIVIDGESIDQTVQLAKPLATQVIVHPWSGFAAQRNVALKYCKSDWVFFLDADEEADVALGEALRQAAQSADVNCFSIRREEYFLGKHLKFGPGNPSFQWRFFRRQSIQFVGDVHEYPQFDGGVRNVDGAGIQHWPRLDIDRFLKKMNHYTTLEALDRFAQGQRTSLLHAVATFFTTFLKNGIRYRGLWNGREGFVLTLLESVSRVIRHLKLWVLWGVYDKRLVLDLGFQLPVPGSVVPPSKQELEKDVLIK